MRKPVAESRHAKTCYATGKNMRLVEGKVANDMPARLPLVA